MKKIYSCLEYAFTDQRITLVGLILETILVQPWFNMASIMECILNNVSNIARWLERGNHGIDCLDYLIFRVDWVINILVRYCDIEEVDQRVIDLLHEVKDMLTASHCTRTAAHQTGTIFTGLHGRPKFNVLKEQLQFVIEQRFSTPAIADILGVIRTVERRLHKFSLTYRSTYSNLSDEDLDTVINSIFLPNFGKSGTKE